MKKLKAIFEFEVPDDTKDVYVFCEAKRRYKRKVIGHKLNIIETENIHGIVPKLIKVK